MRQRRTFYHCIAGAEFNKLPQRGSRSVQRLWSYLLSSKISPAWYLILPPQKTANFWVLMQQRCTLHRWAAGIEPNNLPQRESKSVLQLWSYPLSSKISPEWYLILPPQMTANSWVLLRQRRALYRCVTDIEPNNLPQTDSKSVKWSWSNLPSSKISPAWYLILALQKTANSWVSMWQRRTLYRWKAGTKPNSLPQSD